MEFLSRGSEGVLDFSFDGVDDGAGGRSDPAALATVDLPGAVCRLRRQGAAVSAPYLAAAAHTQAPTAGSVLLAGILLKIGAYGFVRFNLSMLPDACDRLHAVAAWAYRRSASSTGPVALAQRDMKRMIAYSSVSHLGFCMLGVFSLNRLGVQGGVLQMVNHGLSTGGLFALIGMLYERYHTRKISEYGGLARRTPILAFFMVLFTFSSIGVPGLNGFAGEFLLLSGAFQRGWADAPPPGRWPAACFRSLPCRA